MQIEVWLCPNGHYYASSTVHGTDLETKLNLQADLQRDVSHDPAHPRVTGNRGQCQQCKASGRTVQRKRIVIEADVSEVFAELAAA